MTTYSKSGWYLHTLSDSLTGAVQTGTPTAIKLTGTDANQYVSLHNASGTDYAAELDFHSATPAWVTTNEVTGTGWASGGVLASTAAAGSSLAAALTIVGAGPYILQYSWGANLSVAGTTLTAINGMIIYYHDITAAVSKPMLLNIFFGVGYNTVAGTFGVTPSGSGLSQITLTQ